MKKSTVRTISDIDIYGDEKELEKVLKQEQKFLEKRRDKKEKRRE